MNITNKTALATIILLVASGAFAQNISTGIIKDKKTQQPIPFATIGLLFENRGVSANEIGEFTIKVANPGKDSFIISCVGYETIHLPVKTWQNGRTILIEPKNFQLSDVIICNTNKTSYTLNKYRSCSWNHLRIGYEAVYQIAQIFHAPNEEMQITKLEFCKDASESIFRIRIYDLDSTFNCPGNDLLDSVIEVRSKESRITLNLEPYKIFLPSKTFFVAIEWLFIPFNAQTVEEKRDGRRIKWTYYLPSIRYTTQTPITETNQWRLSFNGQWQQVRAFPKDKLQISVTLR